MNLFLIHWRLNTDLFGTQPWNWMKVTAVIVKLSYSLSSHGKLLQSKWLFHYLFRLQQKSCHEWTLAWRKHSFSPIATKQRLWNKLRYVPSETGFPAPITWKPSDLLCYNMRVFLPFAYQLKTTIYPVTQWRKISFSKFISQRFNTLLCGHPHSMISQSACSPCSSPSPHQPQGTHCACFSHL